MKYSCNDVYSPPAKPAVCTLNLANRNNVYWSGEAECVMSPMPQCPNIVSDTVIVTGQGRHEGAALEFLCVPGYHPTLLPVTCSVTDGTGQWTVPVEELCISFLALSNWFNNRGAVQRCRRGGLGFGCRQPGQYLQLCSKLQLQPRLQASVGARFLRRC